MSWGRRRRRRRRRRRCRRCFVVAVVDFWRCRCRVRGGCGRLLASRWQGSSFLTTT
mgnify:CR=1 FL=1